ncbi:ribose-5-phosphate isomerase rki1 [Coemansia sp. RSA 2523]|nr:ribose-5-phosphate isomerase rki1 [Coemansia sp. RSA 1591]KAJ1790674.1 ribose-5-phosphate isomerase rki1 [Coemansia sp. RSA 1938]KAJ1807065.1 ribose-5-phosphate isomerase rki1 [Coemansia sp. RSA 2523]KAJ2185076.1 ribose-5-phosphate isomerase rki1 [Coemansia sp. RSA 532]KAJ2221961.1 ribose-5-phosphate isomerase rki1 [Coemansia sp. RSA 518]KAJ2250498.1 ribose-5-phosphate isomerase rki1 [Coemansia sp. RSA 475]KAJ2272309.1 ribose-5-phosphate isomerase rki1 [Coemansia sp. RSA 370]KAJ2280440.1 
MSSLVEQSKRSAAFAAVDKHVLPSVRVLGIGSGSTVVYAVDRLLELKNQNKLNPDLVCVATSFQSKQLITDAGLRSADLDDLSILDPEQGGFKSIDVTIDGADEVDSELNAIKGGGAAHLREKLVANASNKFVLIADSRKDSQLLGEKWDKGIPVEVSPLAWRTISRQLERMCSIQSGAVSLFELQAPVAQLRQAVRKAGPVVTDNGNFILDVHVGKIYDPPAVEQLFKMIPGVIEVGVFSGMADEAWFGNEDGTIACRIPKSEMKKLD